MLEENGLLESNSRMLGTANFVFTNSNADFVFELELKKKISHKRFLNEMLVEREESRISVRGLGIYVFPLSTLASLYLVTVRKREEAVTPVCASLVCLAFSRLSPIRPSTSVSKQIHNKNLRIQNRPCR